MNRLAHENSPYLLQHANNPVDWYPWGAEALEKAYGEDKPIFLSIGYAACHWCHVMAHESFEDSGIAAIMNEYFVNIKVDREERPDLDSVYMSAVTAITGSGGWPMSVFLTPNGQPFYGGTYFPPVQRYNMPSFRDVLLTVARLWKEDQQRLVSSGQEITNHLLKSQAVGIQSGALKAENLEKAALKLVQTYDWKHGGWGKAPKFPQPMAIEFLLHRSGHGDKLAIETAVHALREMAKGGMYDVVGGGFARYSTDEFWLVPHFEKMLYDNAQLAQTYLHAYLIGGDRTLQQVCEETLDFIARELTDKESGGFFSSLDADSEGQEGKFYLWSFREIQTALSAAQREQDDHDLDWPDFFNQAYDVKEAGNFEGNIVLQRALDDQQLAEHYGLAVEQIPQLLQKMHAYLLKERSKRIRPQTDDKVLVAWNALALMAFSDAARYLKRIDYLEIAQKNAGFLLTHLYLNGRLLRSWRNGIAQHDAFLEDHAALILGLLSLYQSDPNVRWYSFAIQLADDILSHFRDQDGGFFDTRDDQEHLLLRPKDLQGNATPSGNALAAMAFLQLSIYTGNLEWKKLAEQMLQQMQPLAIQSPTAFGKWLRVIDYAITPVQEVVFLGEPHHPAMLGFQDVLWSRYRPNVLVAQSAFPPDPNAPPLLQDRTLLGGVPTAYLCREFTCQQPVNTVDELSNQLARVEK